MMAFTGWQHVNNRRHHSRLPKVAMPDGEAHKAQGVLSDEPGYTRTPLISNFSNCNILGLSGGCGKKIYEECLNTLLYVFI